MDKVTCIDHEALNQLCHGGGGDVPCVLFGLEKLTLIGIFLRPCKSLPKVVLRTDIFLSFKGRAKEGLVEQQ